jgi:DNA-binding NtrC family response regulator
MNAEKTKILVVDNDQHQLETICRGLIFCGYSYYGAPDAITALWALKKERRHPFRLLLTDLTMPRDAGLEIIKKTRQLRPGMPIIAIAGLTVDQATREARAMGTIILQKPFEPDALDRAIKTVLDKSSGGLHAQRKRLH